MPGHARILFYQCPRKRLVHQPRGLSSTARNKKTHHGPHGSGAPYPFTAHRKYSGAPPPCAHYLLKGGIGRNEKGTARHLFGGQEGIFAQFTPRPCTTTTNSTQTTARKISCAPISSTARQRNLCTKRGLGGGVVGRNHSRDALCTENIEEMRETFRCQVVLVPFLVGASPVAARDTQIRAILQACAGRCMQNYLCTLLISISIFRK